MDNLLRYHFNYFVISKKIVKRFSNILLKKKLIMNENNISELLDDMSDWSDEDDTDADPDFQLEVYIPLYIIYT